MKLPVIPLSPYSDPKNYHIAMSVSRKNLAAKDPEAMAALSGCPYSFPTSSFTLICLDHPFTVTYPAGIVKYQGSDLEPYFVLQIVMLNYLSRADGTPLSYEYIPYRNLQGGNAFYAAFHKTAIVPLVAAFGQEPEMLIKASGPFGGMPYLQNTGAGAILYLLPRVPLIYRVWPGDDEFPPQANILFDSSINHYLHTEDVAACDVVTRFLIKQSKAG